MTERVASKTSIDLTRAPTRVERDYGEALQVAANTLQDLVRFTRRVFPLVFQPLWTDDHSSEVYGDLFVEIEVSRLALASLEEDAFDRRTVAELEEAARRLEALSSTADRACRAGRTSSPPPELEADLRELERQLGLADEELAVLRVLRTEYELLQAHEQAANALAALVPFADQHAVCWGVEGRELLLHVELARATIAAVSAARGRCDRAREGN